MKDIILKDNTLISLDSEAIFEWENFTGISLELTFEKPIAKNRSQWYSINNIDTKLLAIYFLNKTADSLKNMTADDFIKELEKMQDTTY